MHTQRRMFRGRGGPTDRRLPKHNAARRGTNHASRPAVNKYQEEDNNNENENENVEDFVLVSDDDKEEENLTDETLVSDNAMDPSKASQPSPCRKEVQHLQKRVQNVRETMQLSAAIANPKTFQDNVLNAVVNCVNEWKSIVQHYPPPPPGATETSSEEDYLWPEMQKPAALAVFEMIQQAVQCGPLKGSKPGYFKRCGGEVAKVVAEFLGAVIPPPDLVDRIGFTTKQMDALKKWKQNAEKAALENKAPSRTAIQHQEGKGKGKKAKKKRKG